MTTTTWTLRHYDKDGTPVTALSAYDTTLSASNVVRYAFNRRVTFNLNSYDEFEFQLYLDDPMAAEIKRGVSVIKLFREVDDPDFGKSYSDSQPSFGGVVVYTLKNGAANTMTVKCFSPLWRLQSHFHLLNHYLETNPDTNDIYTASELVWKLIDLVNGAFGGDSKTGIIEGLFLWGTPDEPQIGPYFVGKGTNTWSNIFDDILNRPSSPEILPGYYHVNGQSTIMVFNTDEKRGQDRTGTLSFRYHTGTNDNCDDMSEEEEISPGQFANYLWVVGQGGPNSGRIAARQNSSSADDSDGYGEVGVYMARVDRDEVKRVSALSPLAQAEFAKRKHPIPTYTVQISPVVGIYYATDFELGDVVPLNATRGALSVTNKKQRIYQVILEMSDNNIETPTVLLSKDFYGKVET